MQTVRETAPAATLRVSASVRPNMESLWSERLEAWLAWGWTGALVSEGTDQKHLWGRTWT